MLMNRIAPKCSVNEKLLEGYIEVYKYHKFTEKNMLGLSWNTNIYGGLWRVMGEKEFMFELKYHRLKMALDVNKMLLS